MRADLRSVPAFFGLAACVLLVASEGGYPATRWYPIGLVLLGLLAVAALALAPARPGRPAAAAVGLLAAYAAWSYLSVAWADQQADAWDGANRTALYAVVLALFVFWPPPARLVPWLVAATGLAVALVAAAELVKLGGGGDLRSELIGGRLSEPAGYPNANAALWMIALLPCAGLAAARRLPAGLRAALLGAAVLLAGMALLGQSRGWLFALPVAAVAFVALAPDPLRALAVLAALGAAALAIRAPVLEVHDVAYLPGDALPDGAAAAVRAILGAAAAAALAGGAIAFADARRQWRWARRRRWGGAVVVGVAAALALAGTGAWALTTADPGQRVADAWDDFKGGQERDTGDQRFTSGLGSNRYDFWRVAWDALERRPLTGVGADNFRQDYLARRRSGEQPRYPHSLELRVLSQTGLVGFALLAGALVAALMAVSGALRHSSRLVATAAGAAAAGFSWFVIHGSVDWFWEFAGLGALSFALLGIAIAAAPERRGGADAEREEAHLRAAEAARSLGLPPPPAPAAPAVAPSRRVGAVAAVVTAALAVSFVLPWLAEREVRDAAAGWRSEPAAAYDALGRAASLNPLSSRPAIVEGTIAVERGEWARAAAAFRDALGREPRNAFAMLELGLVRSRVGDHAGAVAALEQALRLDPRDRITRTVLGLARQRKRLDPRAVNASIARRARSRLR